jgi:hypothetical protein
MCRYFLHALAAALVLAAPAFASDAVTKAQVLDAIRIFDANALGNFGSSKTEAEAGDAVARASNTILRYAVESDDVLIDLGTDSVPWCDVKKGLADMPHSGQRGLLFAAYVSGSIKAQLRSGKADPNPYEGWVGMLQVYRAIRTREGVRIPEVEALLSRQIAGSLEAYAVVALGRSTESLRKSYGEPGGGPSKVSPQQP